MDEASRTYLADLVRESQNNMKADLRDMQKDMIGKMQVIVEDAIKKANTTVFKALREEIRNPGGKETELFGVLGHEPLSTFEPAGLSARYGQEPPVSSASALSSMAPPPRSRSYSMTAASRTPVPSLPELHSASPPPRNLAAQSPSRVVNPFAADTTITSKLEAPTPKLALSSTPPHAPALAAVLISTSTSAEIVAPSLHSAENKQILVPQKALGPNAKIAVNGRTSLNQTTSILSARSSPSTLRESSHGSFTNFSRNQVPSKLLKRSYSGTRDGEDDGIQLHMGYRLDYPPNFGYTPVSPTSGSESPRYAPQSPKYTPTSPASPFPNPILGTAGPNSSLIGPTFSPANPELSLTSPRFSNASPKYTPPSPRFSPKSPAYRTLSPKRRRIGSEELDWKPASHTVNYEEHHYPFSDVDPVMTTDIFYHAPLLTLQNEHSGIQYQIPGILSTSYVNEMGYHGDFGEEALRDKEFDVHNSGENNYGAHVFGDNHSAEIIQSVERSGDNEHFRDMYFDDERFWKIRFGDDQHGDDQYRGKRYEEAQHGIYQHIG